VDNKKFNKYFSAAILIAMTVVTLIATIIKFGPADPAARILLLVSAFGSLMGVAATVMSANGLIITFLFGFLDVTIYAAVCLINWMHGGSGLGNSILHFIYFAPMQIVGFIQWRKRGAKGEESVQARRLTPGRRWAVAGIFLAGSIIAYLIIAQFDRSAANTFIKMAVVLDVLPLMCDILGQLLMSTAYMEQWVCWIGVNVFSLAMWGNALAKDPGSSYALIYIIKYAFYLLNSINGLRNWLILSAPKAEVSSAGTPMSEEN
jgi:nicotinamide mononucleotide transporter